MGVYTPMGREVNGRSVWVSVDHRVGYLFYSDMGSWCVSTEVDMTDGLNQGTLMVESDAEAPHLITESWSVHDTKNWSAGAPGVKVRLASNAEVDAAVSSIKQDREHAIAAAQRAQTVAGACVCLWGRSMTTRWGRTL